MNPKNKSFWLLLIFTLCMALVLPGCITATFETKINSDGSGQRIQDIAIDESFAGLLESADASKGKKGLEEELKANMPKDAKYKKFTQDGKVHYQITFDFKDLDQLNKISTQLNKGSDIPKATDAKLAKTEYIIFANYKFSDEFPSGTTSKLKPEEEQIAKAISINYKLTLPGTITEAKKTDEIDSDTATWHITRAKGGKIEATSRYVRWWLVITLLAALLFMAIIAGILFFLGMRKKKPAPVESPQAPGPSEPTETQTPKPEA